MPLLARKTTYFKRITSITAKRKKIAAADGSDVVGRPNDLDAPYGHRNVGAVDLGLVDHMVVWDRRDTIMLLLQWQRFCALAGNTLGGSSILAAEQP